MIYRICQIFRNVKFDSKSVSIFSFVLTLSIFCTGLAAQTIIENADKSPQTQQNTDESSKTTQNSNNSQTQNSENRVLKLNNDEIENLLKLLKEYEREKRGQQFFKILAINNVENTVVLLNGGSINGLRKGFRLEVFRDSKIITQIELVEVLTEESLARVIPLENQEKIEIGDKAKVIPYLPKDLDVDTNETNNTPQTQPKDDTKTTTQTKSAKDVLKEVSDEERAKFIEEAISKIRKLEDRNLLLQSELLSTQQDLKNLLLREENDRENYKRTIDLFKALQQQYYDIKTTGFFFDLRFTAGKSLLNGLEVNKKDLNAVYSLGFNFESFEKLRFMCFWQLNHQLVESKILNNVIEINATIDGRLNLQFRDTTFNHTFKNSNQSREISLKLQYLRTSTTDINQLLIDKISFHAVNFGVELTKDFEVGHGADYRIFAGLGEFFTIKINYNHSYWCDSAGWGVLFTEFKVAYPLIKGQISFFLKLRAIYQVALNSDLYKNQAQFQINFILLL